MANQPPREAKKLVAPRQSAMPDLSELFRKSILTLILSHVFAGGGPMTVRARILLQSYVRLVDKTLEDYELSRTTFSEYTRRTSNTTFSPLFRAIGYMENCLASLERSLRFARRMAEDKELQAAIPCLEVMRPSVRTRISTIRNAVEHLDDRVIRGKIHEGDLSTLWIGEEHLELQGACVSYFELATWLRELHALAVSLATFQPTARDAQLSVAAAAAQVRAAKRER